MPFLRSSAEESSRQSHVIEPSIPINKVIFINFRLVDSAVVLQHSLPEFLPGVGESQCDIGVENYFKACC